MSNRRRLVVRTIRNGLVTIGGNNYAPQGNLYDGRLDGERYAFGLYYTGAWWADAYVNMIGPADGTGRPGAEVMEDGTLPWMFWDRVK